MASDGFDGLGDRKRCGRPPRFTPVQQAQVKALACELPAASGVPLSRWSAAEVAREVVTAGLVDTISGATVRRWLRTDALKPWQYRSWVALRAPCGRSRYSVIADNGETSAIWTYSMTRSRRPSAQTTAVLMALAEEPSRWRYGYELCQQLDLKAGSMYPILMRLADRGLLETTWESSPPPGRPPRHLYRLTGSGVATAAEPTPTAGATSSATPRAGQGRLRPKTGGA